VVTSAGLHGTVVQVKEDTVTLRIAENVKVEFDKSSIARLQKAGA
jgi:preprotein translocase subunit YajC